MMYYSPTTGTFYAREVHGENMPADVVEISKQAYNELLDGRALGSIIIMADNGLPVLTDPPPKTQQEIENAARSQRDSALNSTDWVVQRHQDQLAVGVETTLTEHEYNALQEYRQALRLWPEQAGWPDIELPPPPTWLSQL
ncbi:tail fiber assembly protein [Aeromonas dhakensis]|uniref:tail fiber assembly protein n=1 Tax=Aeromonas dhakensis TaxID=196024 RepID=UPI003BA31EE2